MKKVFICLSVILVCLAYSSQPKETSQPTDVFLSKVLTGAFFSINETKVVSDLPWNPHASFKGVYLKHLIVGKTTQYSKQKQTKERKTN